MDLIEWNISFISIHLGLFWSISVHSVHFNALTWEWEKIGSGWDLRVPTLNPNSIKKNINLKLVPNSIKF